MTDEWKQLLWLIRNKPLLLTKRFVILAALVVSVLLYSFFRTLNVFDLPIFPAIWLLPWALLCLLAWLWAMKQHPREERLLQRLSDALHAMDYIQAKKIIAEGDSYRLQTPKFRFEFGLEKATYYSDHQNDTKTAFAVYQSLKSMPLLPAELCRVELALGFLLLQEGNLKAARKFLERCAVSDCSESEYDGIAFLKSRLFELSGEITQAKNVLVEHLQELETKGITCAASLHQLALLETAHGNNETALSYYQKAWEQLLKDNIFSQLERSARNLILLLATLRRLAQAEKVLEQFENRVNLKNIAQVMALANIKTEYFRQIKDRKRLIAHYDWAETVILPLLSTQERFYYEVNSVRMCWNDGINFEAVLIRAMRALMKSGTIEPLNRLECLNTVKAIIEQVIEQTGGRSDLYIYHGWLVIEWMRLQEEFESARTDFSIVSTETRMQWLRLSFQGVKLRLNLFSHGLPNTEFKAIFDQLAELKRVWADNENPQEELDAIVIIVDEYLAFSKQISDAQFAADFKQLALEHLEQGRLLLEKNKSHPGFYQYYVALAYFYSQFGFDKAQVKSWLDAFDNKNQSLEHKALWFREYYEVARRYVA